MGLVAAVVLVVFLVCCRLLIPLFLGFFLLGPLFRLKSFHFSFWSPIY